MSTPQLSHSITLNRLFSALVSLLMVFSLGCSAAASTPVAQEPDSITLQLAWVPTIEYSGFYVAEADGFYTEENLDVTFVNGGFDDKGAIDHVGRVIAGEADFGLASADRILIARSEGAPLVAIATLYQRSPIAWMSLAEKNITRPEDFVGKKVFVDDIAGSTGIAYVALLASLGIDRAEIEEIPRDDFSNEPLTSGRVDVASVFINNQPVQMRQEGVEINTILASDYGIEIYANVIFTTEDMIKNNPDLVARFLRATLKGLQTAVDNPARAAEITVAVSEDLNLESETQSMQEALPLFAPAGSKPGQMSAQAWEIAYDILNQQDLLKGTLTLEDAYTLEFLNQIYGQ